MNLTAFLDHWKITENPFQGEEARQDPVFLRLEAANAAASAPSTDGVPPSASAPLVGPTTHSDFDKIVGSFDRASTSIVFGEKGSGKTAIRMQLADRIAAHNRASPPPGAKCLLIPHDDWNPMLARFLERVGNERKPNITESLGKFRLVDHIDAILLSVVPRLTDAVLKPKGSKTISPPTPTADGVIELGDDPRKTLRRLDPSIRRDLLILQAVYDRPERAADRTRRLRSTLRLPIPISFFLWTLLALFGWAAPAWLAWWAFQHNKHLKPEPDGFMYSIGGLAALYILILLKVLIWDRLSYLRIAHRLRRQIRVSARSDTSYARSLRQLPSSALDSGVGGLPLTNSDEPRYAMFDRLRRVLDHFGYTGLMVVIDRVDEPTLISGDPDRMRAIVWPMLNNKFLQHPGLSVKMLLPIELRHALFRESAAFFQEARLDKQNLIERLGWTGAMLYDLCNTRLQACRVPASESITLLDLFAEDVTRQDLVDSLDQMHQPRDAFKMLYQCFTEHCSNVTTDQAQWRVPRHVLENVRKVQVERVRQLYKGVRPA